MTDVCAELVNELDKPKGFDPYYADIVHARDLVDPPIRRHRRDASYLSLSINNDEFDVVSSVDKDDGRLNMTFGFGGLIDISSCISEVAKVDDVNNEKELAIDGLRFALVFQASHIFINSRLRLDNGFMDRFISQFDVLKESQVPYERQVITYPENGMRSPLNDSALQYRVGRLASRIALDRIITTPYSKVLQNSNNSGQLIIEANRKKLDYEVETAVVIPGDELLNKGIAWATVNRLNAEDNYPLMWAALANPASRGALSSIALAHIGKRAMPKPGWTSL